MIIFSFSLLLAYDNYCITDELTQNPSNREYYEIGDIISEEDQNHLYDVCHGDENHETGSSFKFSDYSGDIILISMNATW